MNSIFVPHYSTPHYHIPSVLKVDFHSYFFCKKSVSNHKWLLKDFYTHLTSRNMYCIFYFAYIAKQESWSKNFFCEFLEKKFEWKRCTNSKNSGVNSEKVVSKKKGLGWIDLNHLIDQKVQIWSQQCSSQPHD